jgi:ribonuclease D
MSAQIVNQQQELTTICEHLKEQNRIAIDLEFDKNYYRYGFNLCLMQIYDGTDCYLIDPLSSKLTIDTIFPVLESETVEKVAFAFGEDLRLLHTIGCFPKNVYDLDYAISLLNYSPASLTNHLKNILDIETGKSSQMSNWYDRPLSQQQTQYASEDVLYLFSLHDHLRKEADQKKVAHWIDQENRAALLEDYSAVDSNGSVVKHKNKKHFSEREWHIYVRLMETREQLSESLNRPSFKVIKKEIMMDIARKQNELNNWTNTRGIHRRLRNDKIKKKLEKVVKQAEQEADERGLSDSESADTPLSSDERTERRRLREKVNLAKDELFNPIKEKIEEDYGKEVSTFLFSNRIIDEIVSDENPNLLPYKQNLLKEYAKSLDLELTKYLHL